MRRSLTVGDRWLRSFLRHEHLSIAMALTSALHHSAHKTHRAKYDATRRQNKGDEEMAQPIPQERVSKPMAEHFVSNVPMPQVCEVVVGSVDFPMPWSWKKSSKWSRSFPPASGSTTSALRGAGPPYFGRNRASVSACITGARPRSNHGTYGFPCISEQAENRYNCAFHITGALSSYVLLLPPQRTPGPRHRTTISAEVGTCPNVEEAAPPQVPSDFPGASTTTCRPRTPRSSATTQHASSQVIGHSLAQAQRIPRNNDKKNERLLGSQNFSESSQNVKNLVSRLSPAPQSSSGAPPHKKGRKDIIHLTASTESISITCKLIESANIRCIFFAIKKYLNDLQQGHLLLEQREDEHKELSPYQISIMCKKNSEMLQSNKLQQQTSQCIKPESNDQTFGQRS